MLLSPKYTKVSELESLIINSTKASYDYLIKLSYKCMTESACNKRDILLEEYKTKLKDLNDDIGGKFKGHKTWLKELSVLEEVVSDGLKLGWDYGKDNVLFKD